MNDIYKLAANIAENYPAMFETIDISHSLRIHLQNANEQTGNV